MNVWSSVHAHSASFLNQKCEKSVWDAKKMGLKSLEGLNWPKIFANFCIQYDPQHYYSAEVRSDSFKRDIMQKYVK